MRCPKCKKITFDYVEICPNCGYNLSGTFTKLGDFTKPDPEFNWFELNLKNLNSQTMANQDIRGSSPISHIDVSDLVTGSQSNNLKDNLEQLDTDKLGNAAQDENFQEALDQVLKD